MPKRKPGSQPIARTTEDPAVEMLTVAWMLSVMTALACELGFAAARGYLLITDVAAPTIQLLAVTLVFAALVVGLVSLLLGYAVLRARRIRPPRGILVFAAVVGAAPLVTLLIRLLVYASGAA